MVDTLTVWLTNVRRQSLDTRGNLRILQTEFRFDVRTEEQGTVLELFGELDVASSPTLEAELNRLVDARLLVVDLRALEFIDSTGLGVLVRAHHRWQEQGNKLALVKGDGQVERLLVLTGLADRLPIAETAAELLGGS